MDMVRKFMGIRRRPGPDLASPQSHDDELSLSHLRRLFMEFRHSPTPMTVKEQEDALFSMLPLFCNIFTNSKPSSLTEKFGDVCQFAAHVSQLMGREIRKRHSNRNHDISSTAVMNFLLLKSSEDRRSGWELLNALNILASGETPILECMVAANLPSSMVKCLCLFYELPPLNNTSGLSIEKQLEDRKCVQELYSQILLRLCHSPATASELMNTDDLAILFSAISCPCSKDNVGWRNCASEVVMTITRYGLSNDVINYIHDKSCIANCLENMRRIQRANPLELVEMIVALVCCLKDSSNFSHLLLSDFSRCKGYLFLHELLLMLSEIEGDEARESCRNVALLVSKLVMIGHVDLRPLISLGTPFQDRNFELPEPSGGGVSVKNVEAFHVLQKVFLKTTDKLLSLNILDCISNIYRSDNANYFILEPQQTIKLFVDKAPEKSKEVQDKVFELLDLVICNLNWVPCTELMSVSILFKKKGLSDCHQVALSFLIRIVSFNPKYKDFFREMGILEVLTNCLKDYAVILKERDENLQRLSPLISKKCDGNSSSDSEEKEPTCFQAPRDYPFLLMGCIRLLLENNPENAKVFRELGGARCAHNMVPYAESRLDALRIIHELILNGGSDDMGTLLGLMHSTETSAVGVKIEVLNALLKIFELDPRTRAVFREVGGFVYVMAVPLSMEGSLAIPTFPMWEKVKQEDILTLLRTVFHVLTAAMQDEPANKNFFMDEVRFRGLADTIRLLGCFSLDNQVMPPYTGETKPAIKKLSRMLSSSTAHLPLTPCPSNDSIRSSVDTPSEPDLSLSTLLYSANEMFKNLFEMATDSFGGLKAVKYGSTDVMIGPPVLSIYHSGAITAAVDLLPAICEMGEDGGFVSNTDNCLELQMYWLSHLQCLLRSEHNQQVMCQAGLPQQLLERCEAAFIDDYHPLNAPLQRMFERLASQALTPTVLRDFLRLGNPLLCKTLIPPDEEPHPAQESQLDQSDGSLENSTEVSEAFQTETKVQEEDKAIRKISDAISRKISDTPSRGRADSRSDRGTLEKRANLSYCDPMMSMIQPSPESSCSEDSDSDDDRDFELLVDEGGDDHENQAIESRKDGADSYTESSPGGGQTSPEEDPPPKRPPRKRDQLNASNPFDSSDKAFNNAMALQSPGSAGKTVVVDGVDVDTDADSQQEVSTIDQGDDLVIVDVSGNISQTPSLNTTQASQVQSEEETSDNSQSKGSMIQTSEQSQDLTVQENDQSQGYKVQESSQSHNKVNQTTNQPQNIVFQASIQSDESENQESELTLSSGLSESFKDSLGKDLSSDISRRSSQSSITSLENSTEFRESNHKAAEMSVEDISQQLSLHCAQEPDLQTITDETPQEHSATESQTVDIEPEIPKDKPVPLTRIKCLVSMTTPRDARAHGLSYCPAFVEFNMSVDGFGCLFLPAVAPQAAPGVASVVSVVGNAVVETSVPGIGTGERLFPPQAGLTFTSWLCVDRFSNPTDDPHPVRLLTVARHFRTGDGKVQMSPCLSLSISAKDKMLVVRTEESAMDDLEESGDQSQREHTEARFLSDLLLEEGRWHHVMVILNKALIRNSTATLFVDGQHVATSKLKYVQAGLISPDSASNAAPYIVAYVGTPPAKRRCSRLLWKLGPTHLIEEPLQHNTAMKMFLLGPNYVGSFQSPSFEGESMASIENVEPLVSAEKVMFGIHAHAQSVLSMAKIRKHFRRLDTRAIAKELGLNTHDNSTPIRLIHNTAAHLPGSSRTMGSVLIGCSGLRTFCPNPVTKLIECIGSVSCLLGLVAMATGVEALYASVKALSCVLRSNPSCRRDMDRTRGYQILALLLRQKKHLLNTHILHLTFALVGTVDSDRESSIIPNVYAFRDLLCDLEVWHDGPGDLERSLYTHFMELLGTEKESKANIDLMQRLGLVPKLLFILQDETVSDSTTHAIASILSVLLSNTNEVKNLIRFGQFLVSTISSYYMNENELNLNNDKTHEQSKVEDENDGSTRVNTNIVTPKKIRLRNVLLELILCLIYGDGESLDHRFSDALQETLGFDWVMMFIHPHIHKTTVVRATRILVTMLGSPTALERFKEGLNNGGWLTGTEIMLLKTPYVVAGFNVGAVSEDSENYEICREVCNVPGFAMLSSLLPRHVEVPEIYHLVIALLLGHPVSDVYAGVQFDWHNLYSVFWSSTSIGVKAMAPSPRDPTAHTIYCPDAANVLLYMAKTMVNEEWENTEEGSWLREYPVTLIQFLMFLYRNVAQFSAVCTENKQEFLENLVAVLFPKRRRLLKSQEVISDSEGEGEASNDLMFSKVEKTLLITHPAKKFILEFLTLIVTDSLTCTSSSKSLGVIDIILESYPPASPQPQQAEFQTEVVSAQMDYFLGGNLLANPSAGHGNHAKIVSNAFLFASKVVDKLWIGNFKLSYKVVFNFITSIMEAVKGQSVSLEGIYHSLNRTILYQLSRPLARLTDQTSLLEFLHILTTNHKVIFAPGNNEPEFIAGVSHWLLVMGTQNRRTSSEPVTSTPIKEMDSTAISQAFGAESAFEANEYLNEAAEEESSCRRLLEAAAERVWDIFLLNKKEAIDEIFKTELPMPSFTSYSPRDYLDYMPVGSSSNLNLDLKSVRPLIGDAAMKLWVNFVTNEEKHKAEALGQQKPKRRTVARLTTRRTKKDNRDVKGLARESFLWTPKHIKVVRDLVRLLHKNHQQNYQLISKSIAEDWSLMERDLTRERGVWGPPRGSSLDKWTLDLVEGPHRMRKKMCRNELFYVHYPFSYKLEQSQKRSRYKKAISFDSKRYYLLRGPALPGIGPIEALLQNEDSEKLKITPARSMSEESSYVTETNEGSEVDNQTIVKLLEAGERIRSMYRCARVQGLDTAEGLFLFGQRFFYVVDGVTLLSTKEIKDIDSLPPGTHDPIIPRSSHDITKSFTKERMCSKWAYDDIREVHKRRYLLQQTALEVFSSDGRNHFLVFPKSVRNKVYDKLLTTSSTQLVSAEESISGMKRDTDVETGVGIINSLMGERSVTQRWERGEITNFQYLMHLNTLAGRSYNDLMQYPVFPWILADYDSEELDLTNPKTFRDFSKPMGAQGQSRLEHIKKRYREWEDPTGETPPYHYGTHYSSAMIVSSYLIRMEPFSQHFLRLQGGHFDLPDRLFHSVKDSWLSASETNIHDVKELIPEFFYLPEFLTNHNSFDLGIKQSGEPLGDVILPRWAKGDPREFIRLHREALECDYVSARLHEWIDLIFGYRQQGPGAVESFNVFHHLFYEGNVDIHGIDDQVKKSATIGFINNFGQTPKQLFKKPHPTKKVFRVVEPDLQLGGATTINIDKKFFHNLPNLVPSVHPVKELKGPVGIIYQSERGLLAAVERNKLLIPPNYNRCIAWGFGDLSMRIGYYETDKGMNVYENFHIGQVLCAACPDSRTLITGGTSSLVCVWDIVKGAGKKPQLLLHEVLYGHQSSVTCLAVSTSYQLIVSGSEDQTCIIWDLSKLSYVRQLSDHGAPITAIAINELTGDITTCVGTFIYVWSVNGQLIVKDNTSLKSNNHIQCCAMSELSDWDEDNVILTGSLDGVVRMWGIEFYNEAETSRKYRKSVSELSPVKEVTTDSSTDKESQCRSENPTPDPIPDNPDKDIECAIESSESTDVDQTDPVSPPKEEDTDLPPKAPKLSEVKQHSSNLDEEYVIIENEKKKDFKKPQPIKPVWRRRLKLRHQLTMHTSFGREDNVAPAAITALLISKDHRKLFVGDGRGRIFSWSVTEAAGRMPADHWIKDEGAECCSQCGVRFTFAERRHHCRDCGKLFCAKCSKYESSIQRLRIHKPVRVCKLCFDKLKKEQPKGLTM